MTRLKVAELTSGVGALVLGVGLGALFPSGSARLPVSLRSQAWSLTPSACGTSIGWSVTSTARTADG